MLSVSAGEKYYRLRRWPEAAVVDSRQCTDILQQQIPDQLTAEYVKSKDCWVNI